MRYEKAFKVEIDQSLGIYNKVRGIIFDLGESADPRASYSAFRGVMGTNMTIILISENPDEDVIKQLEDVISGEEVELPLDLVQQLEARRANEKFRASLTGQRTSDNTYPEGKAIRYRA